MSTTPRRQPAITAFALVAALIACLSSTPAGSSTPVASLATVTPGGHISVSLLTPTLTQMGTLEALATPIGPVATATAAAATAAAATATALVPTPTIPGVFTEPARCPQPGSPSLPIQPPAFNAYAETIVQYLSAGGATTLLEARLRVWNAITDLGGLVLVDRDFTGDGVPEVLVEVLNPQQAEFPFPGDLFIYGCDEGTYRLLYQAGYQRDRSAPVIYRADDINGDYLNEVVFSREFCGASTCLTEVQVIGWSLTLGNFVNLLAEGISDPSAELRVEDIDGDRLSEIVITGGVITSAAAGPQRIYTRTLHWDGTQYAVASLEYEPAEYRIHVIHDADNALRAGDYAGAISLYQQAINDTGLLSWQYPNEAQHLTAYARYRIMLAYAALGDVGAAQRTRDELVAMYSVFPTPEGGVPNPPTISGLPGGTFAEMARLFWNDFALNRNISTACQVVIGYARAAPSAYEVLNSFGTANPIYTPVDLCPF